MREKLTRSLPTLTEVANFVAFVVSDRASAMTGAIANLTCGSVVEVFTRAIFLSFPQQLIRPRFIRLALDRLESERIVFFTGGVTNGS